MSSENVSNGETRRACILIVDDDPGVTGMLQAVLKTAGYGVVTAADAAEATDVLGNCDVAVALVDIVLPDGSGLDLCGLIREKHGAEVILLTGDDQRYSYEDAARSGAHDFILKPLKPRELVLRTQRAVEARQLSRSREEAVRELERVAITDGLTGLFNSRHFFERLEAEIARAERYHHDVSLILLDVDHFKQLNDTYGHQEGDRALARLAEAIRSGIRESDSAYRYGGEEFTIILPETDSKEAMSVAHRLMDEFSAAEIRPGNGQTMHLAASIGLAQREADEDMRSLLQRADAAMYASKHAGRGRITASPGSQGD